MALSIAWLGVDERPGEPGAKVGLVMSLVGFVMSILRLVMSLVGLVMSIMRLVMFMVGFVMSLVVFVMSLECLTEFSDQVSIAAGRGYGD